MARRFGYQLTTLSLAAQSLLADTLSIDWSDSADVEDTTTLGDTAHESTAGLVGGDDIAWELFYDNTVTTGTFAFLVGKLGVSSSLIISDGVRTITAPVIITKVGMPVAVAEMMKLSVTAKRTGAVVYS